jgi:hypothetical protein
MLARETAPKEQDLRCNRLRITHRRRLRLQQKRQLRRRLLRRGTQVMHGVYGDA